MDAYCSSLPQSLPRFGLLSYERMPSSSGNKTTLSCSFESVRAITATQLSVVLRL